MHVPSTAKASNFICGDRAGLGTRFSHAQAHGLLSGLLLRTELTFADDLSPHSIPHEMRSLDLSRVYSPWFLGAIEKWSH